MKDKDKKYEVPVANINSVFAGVQTTIEVLTQMERKLDALLRGKGTVVRCSACNRDLDPISLVLENNSVDHIRCHECGQWTAVVVMPTKVYRAVVEPFEKQQQELRERASRTDGEA